MSKKMPIIEPNLEEVEKRLAVVIGKERKEVIGYTLLTILCTPFFVAVTGIIVFFILIFIFSDSTKNIEYISTWSAVYTSLNFFLGSMIMFVLRYSNPPEEPHEFDIGWLGGVVLFIILLIFTYATNYQQDYPRFFGIVYAILGIIILILNGSVYMNNPVPEDSNTENPFLSLILLFFAFIAMSYGEISRGSWLFFPPKPDEIRLSAWILCKLVMGNT